jgi:hypothetical protein
LTFGSGFGGVTHVAVRRDSINMFCCLVNDRSLKPEWCVDKGISNLQAVEFEQSYKIYNCKKGNKVSKNIKSWNLKW